MADSNLIRVCPRITCHVITYQVRAYPDKVDHACPGCGKIGQRQPS